MDIFVLLSTTSVHLYALRILSHSKLLGLHSNQKMSYKKDGMITLLFIWQLALSLTLTWTLILTSLSNLWCKIHTPGSVMVLPWALSKGDNLLLPHPGADWKADCNSGLHSVSPFTTAVQRKYTTPA